MFVPGQTQFGHDILRPTANWMKSLGHFFARSLWAEKKCFLLTASTSHIAIAAIFLRRGQVAGEFPRKSAIFGRNSQNEIAIASDGNSQRFNRNILDLCLFSHGFVSVMEMTSDSKGKSASVTGNEVP